MITGELKTVVHWWGLFRWDGFLKRYLTSTSVITGELVGAVQVGWISEEVFNNNFLPRQRYCENVPCYILLCFFSLNLDVLLHCVFLNDWHTGPEFFAGYDDRPFLLSK